MLGADLDSLADVVSFGVLPSLVMYRMLSDASDSSALPYIAFAIAVFSALRLAIFNVDETQRDSFRGLNTPANTIFMISLPLLYNDVGQWLYQPEVLVVITIIFSLLLVSRIEFFAFKFKSFGWQENKVRYTFLIVSALLLLIFRFAGIPLMILLYIALSLFVNGSKKTVQKH